MKKYGYALPTPVRRDLTDPRSSSAGGAPARKTLLTDRRSTR